MYWIEASMMTLRLALCATDQARGTGEGSRSFVFCVSEGATATRDSARSRRVVTIRLSMRLPNAEFPENNQRNQTTLPRNGYSRASTGNNLSWHILHILEQPAT